MTFNPREELVFVVTRTFLMEVSNDQQTSYADNCFANSHISGFVVFSPFPVYNTFPLVVQTRSVL